ncbi:cell envelope integrity protein TolA [Mesorhizobium retamae]|uniref:Cell envelope integrity protein TolA n=1 Tax=Mesorhizobium retamae TaxID=2912854 RepID=A0ABS9QML6_9HYPH|nr:cell envelope integrity protein TolA [Mesorhizobium sp. IRAMC:0171]MCG7508698.1 cell envelope integrity protein TolA [Mesorhizobium sp. IRAMC:0171]
MKAGLTTSVILHAAVIGFGLFTLRAPPAFQPMDVESFPVDIVPVEDVAQSLQGDKKSTVRDKPAPKPTQRPDIVADAQKIGENSVDTDNPVTPAPKPKPVENTESAPKAPIPTEKPKPEDTPKPKEEPKPTPATEVAPAEQPKQDVKPDPIKQPDPKPQPMKEPEPAPKPAEQKPAEAKPEPAKPDAVAEAIASEQTESVALPNSAPAPEAKPRPEQAQAETAKAPDRKNSDKPVKEASSRQKSEDDAFNDKVAALLNKDKPSGGGAKRSSQQSSLGGDRNNGQKLSNSEMGALRDQLSGCWTIPAGAQDAGNLVAVIRFNVDQSGKLDGRPTVQTSSGNRSYDESAVRAIQKCDQAGLVLPAGKQDIWSEIQVTFNPSDMGM